MEIENKCPICHQQLMQGYGSNHGDILVHIAPGERVLHAFHQECLKPLLKKNSCPLCGKKPDWEVPKSVIQGEDKLTKESKLTIEID